MNVLRVKKRDIIFVVVAKLTTQTWIIDNIKSFPIKAAKLYRAMQEQIKLQFNQWGAYVIEI
jgi:hypothetical protein